MADREKVINGLEICEQDEKLCFTETECPYQSKFPRCCITLIHDALELLKAREPRLMTLEDAKQTMEGEIVWVEQWTKSKVFLMPMVFTGDGRLGNFYLGLNLNEMNPHYYRVWRGKPTDEQREAVKWDG